MEYNIPSQYSTALRKRVTALQAAKIIAEIRKRAQQTVKEVRELTGLVGLR